jgi:hypothetical protein
LIVNKTEKNGHADAFEHQKQNVKHKLVSSEFDPFRAEFNDKQV